MDRVGVFLALFGDGRLRAGRAVRLLVVAAALAALSGCAHRGPVDPDAAERRAERRERVGAALRGMSEAMRPAPRVRCTSRIQHDTVDTVCN